MKYRDPWPMKMLYTALYPDLDNLVTVERVVVHLGERRYTLLPTSLAHAILSDPDEPIRDGAGRRVDPQLFTLHEGEKGPEVTRRASTETLLWHWMYGRVARGMSTGKSAERRAKKMLRSWLLPQQRLDWQRHGWFEVVGESTQRYILTGEGVEAIHWLEPHKWQVLGEFCLHPDTFLWHEDIMLSHKLMIEEDEEGFLKEANYYPHPTWERVPNSNFRRLDELVKWAKRRIEVPHTGTGRLYLPGTP